MTPTSPQPPQKEHCEHEEICRFFLHDSKVAVHDGTPCMRNHSGCAKCAYDSRPTPKPLSEVFKDFDNNAMEWLKAHDNQIRNATLDTIAEFVLSDCNVRIDERNGKKFLVLSGEFPVSKLLEKIQSLRTQEHP